MSRTGLKKAPTIAVRQEQPAGTRDQQDDSSTGWPDTKQKTRPGVSSHIPHQFDCSRWSLQTGSYTGRSGTALVSTVLVCRAQHLVAVTEMLKQSCCTFTSGQAWPSRRLHGARHEVMFESRPTVKLSLTDSPSLKGSIASASKPMKVVEGHICRQYSITITA